MYTTANGYTKESIISIINNDFKGKSVTDDDFICLYLSNDNRKCAIGLFIPDGHAGQRSTDGIDCVLNKFNSLWNYMPLSDIQGLSEFQNVHDILKKSDNLEKQKSILIEWVKNNVA